MLKAKISINNNKLVILLTADNIDILLKLIQDGTI